MFKISFNTSVSFGPKIYMGVLRRLYFIYVSWFGLKKKKLILGPNHLALLPNTQRKEKS